MAERQKRPREDLTEERVFGGPPLLHDFIRREYGKYGSCMSSYSSDLDASPLYSAISMVHRLAPRFPVDGVGTLASPQPTPQSALGEESREADRLQ
jgi:hypothetical protein